MQTSRKTLLGVIGVAFLVGAVVGWKFWPQAPVTAAVLPDQPPVVAADIVGPGELADMALGSDKAPVTVIEYASMTCPHCARFAAATLPELKKRYIDAGKVRYVLREFPLDNLAAVAFMLARCAGKDDPNKYYALVDVLFSRQTTWAVEQPLPPLLAITKQAGFTEASFNACLANQQILDGIQKVRQRAIDVFKVQSTPTFVVNGKVYKGAMSIDELAKIIDPYLKAE